MRHRFRNAFGLFLSGLVAFIAPQFGYSEAAPPPLVYKQVGTLPIILSAPHGGRLDVPGVPVRTGNGQDKEPGKFVATRDSGTEELAYALSEAIERRFGKKPYVVVSRGHRKFLDPNRPADTAYEDPDAQPIYADYHATLVSYCRDVQKQFRQGLLLDLHGQGTSAKTVFRGTHNGKTVSLLRERHGETAVHGDASLLGLLKARGWTVFPDPLDGREQAAFLGGYIVQTYGGNQGLGIDAVQLEFGQDYRTDESRAKTAATLADALADYATRYLDTPPATTSPAPAKGANCRD
jgi:N-formylglutamate amidohydrolase